MATTTKKKTTTAVKNSPVVEKTKFAYKVEQGVTMQGVRNHNLLDKFPFAIMKPGDSFLIPKTDPIAKSPNSLHYAAKQYAKIKPGFLLATRIQLDGHRRVWRIK
jgi:hypothetical protein